MNLICPCASNESYKNCCGYFHEKLGFAKTAEILMKSRYSAFVFKNEKYLLETWHKSTRPKSLNLNSQKINWIGLQILNKEKGGDADSKGIVEFVAKYSIDSKIGSLHEISSFVKESSIWFYTDGKIIND
jgi:SEC-C motif-containing protein